MMTNVGRLEKMPKSLEKMPKSSTEDMSQGALIDKEEDVIAFHICICMNMKIPRLLILNARCLEMHC
jgi:hypothetical protein